MNKTAEGINFYCYQNKAIKSFSLKQGNTCLYRHFFCMNDQWAWSWSADWADILIKQVAGKTYRTIPSGNLMVNATLLNLPPYCFITILRPSNMCHIKQTAFICLCKSWHKKRLNMFRSLNTAPKVHLKCRESPQNSTGKLLSAPYKCTAQMRAVLKPYKGELPVGKKRKLPRANWPWSTFSDWDSLSRKVNRYIDTTCHNCDW